MIHNVIPYDIGGLKPEILVTAMHGSTVKVDGASPTATVAGTIFTDYIFRDVSYGTHTVTATNGSISHTKSVTVEKVKQYRINFAWVFDEQVTLSGGIESSSGWLHTVFIPVTPSASCTFQGQGSIQPSSILSNILNEYDSSRAFVDYWTDNNATKIDSVDGFYVYERTFTLSSRTRFIMINIREKAYQHCKVWVDSNLVFDGAKYPPTR